MDGAREYEAQIDEELSQLRGRYAKYGTDETTHQGLEGIDLGFGVYEAVAPYVGVREHQTLTISSGDIVVLHPYASEDMKTQQWWFVELIGNPKGKPTVASRTILEKQLKELEVRSLQGLSASPLEQRNAEYSLQQLAQQAQRPRGFVPAICLKRWSIGKRRQKELEEIQHKQRRGRLLREMHNSEVRDTAGREGESYQVQDGEGNTGIDGDYDAGTRSYSSRTQNSQIALPSVCEEESDQGQDQGNELRNSKENNERVVRIDITTSSSSSSSSSTTPRASGQQQGPDDVPNQAVDEMSRKDEPESTANRANEEQREVKENEFVEDREEGDPNLTSSTPFPTITGHTEQQDPTRRVSSMQTMSTTPRKGSGGSPNHLMKQRSPSRTNTTPMASSRESASILASNTSNTPRTSRSSVKRNPTSQLNTPPKSVVSTPNNITQSVPRTSTTKRVITTAASTSTTISPNTTPQRPNSPNRSIVRKSPVSSSSLPKRTTKTSAASSSPPSHDRTHATTLLSTRAGNVASLSSDICPLPHQFDDRQRTLVSSPNNTSPHRRSPRPSTSHPSPTRKDNTNVMVTRQAISVSELDEISGTMYPRRICSARQTEPESARKRKDHALAEKKRLQETINMLHGTSDTEVRRGLRGAGWTALKRTERGAQVWDRNGETSKPWRHGMQREKEVDMTGVLRQRAIQAQEAVCVGALGMHVLFKPTPAERTRTEEGGAKGIFNEENKYDYIAKYDYSSNTVEDGRGKPYKSELVGSSSSTHETAHHSPSNTLSSSIDETPVTTERSLRVLYTLRPPNPRSIIASEDDRARRIVKKVFVSPT